MVEVPVRATGKWGGTPGDEPVEPNHGTYFVTIYGMSVQTRDTP